MPRSLATAALAVALAAAAPVAQDATIVQYPLPAEVTFPEGVAYDADAGVLYVGSAATGSIARLTVADSKATVLSAAGTLGSVEPFPGMLGMKIDGAGRLWVAGGRTGRITVVDARTGKTLKQLQTPAEPAGLLNDVVVVGGSAYVTDTFRPTLWRVTTAAGQVGELEAWLDFSGTPLEYGEGANLNGIAATADGRSLIVVQMNKGLLFRIGLADKSVTPIDVKGEALATADGLVLDGRTLYVVRQGEQEIVTVSLAADLKSGQVVNRFKNPALAWPATAARVNDQLVVVNTQFNKRQSNDARTPFSLVGVPLAMLEGK
jgi:sugar lactone lactonase YvrE